MFPPPIECMRLWQTPLLILAIAVLIMPAAAAQDTTEAKAGWTPDSFLYFFDVLFDDLAILFTSDQVEKAKASLRIAGERGAELRLMLEKKDIDAAVVAEREHKKVIDIASQVLDALERENPDEEIENVIKIEKEFLEHNNEIEESIDELRLKFKLDIRGEITPEQQALVDSILTNVENHVGELEIKIDERKGRTRIRIKDSTGETDIDIDIRIRDIERKHGLDDLKRERAEHRIRHATDAVEEAGEVAIDTPPIPSLLQEARDKLALAQAAFDDENFGEAFGQATAAESIAESVIRLSHHNGDADTAFTIIVTIEGDRARVAVRLGDRKFVFDLDNMSEEEFILLIAERIGMSPERVRTFITFRIVEPEPERILVAFEEIPKLNCLITGEHVIRTQEAYDALDCRGILSTTLATRDTVTVRPVINFETHTLLGKLTRATGCSREYDRSVTKNGEGTKYLYKIVITETGLCKPLEINNNWILVPVISPDAVVGFKVEIIKKIPEPVVPEHKIALVIGKEWKQGTVVEAVLSNDGDLIFLPSPSGSSSCSSYQIFKGDQKIATASPFILCTVVPVVVLPGGEHVLEAEHRLILVPGRRLVGIVAADEAVPRIPAHVQLAPPNR